MTLLLEFKEKCKQIYANYGYIILPLIKFILAFGIFYSINTSLNFSEIAGNIFLVLILALICCVLPLGVTTFFGSALLVLQCYSVGIEVAGFAVALILLLLIFYVRFTPEDAIVLLLTPVAFLLHIPCAVPVGYGLIKKPATAFSAACGVVVYYFMLLVQQKSTVLQATAEEEISKNLQLLVDGLLNNANLLVNIVAFAAVMLTVYLIRRLSVDYAWQIAIFTGAVMYVIIWVLASLFMDVECSYAALILGTIAAILVIEIFAFFRYGVDYSRTEYHQFEDDDYYYYVKAVPKARIAEKNVTVKKIHTKEPEVVVEDVKVYKTRTRSEDEERNRVSGNTNSRQPLADAAKEEFEMEQERTERKTFREDSRDVRKEFFGEKIKENTRDFAEPARSDGDDDIDFQKKLEESLKNL